MSISDENHSSSLFLPNVSAAVPKNASSKAWSVSDYTAILSGHSWVSGNTLETYSRPTFLTYSFPKTMPSEDAQAWPDSIKSWRTFTKQDQKDARKALKIWGDACGIKFLEVGGTSQSDIKFDWIPSSSSAFAQYPMNYAPTFEKDNYTYYYSYSGSIHLNTHYKQTFKSDPEFKKYILLHEIGHALGLKHTFDTHSTINAKTLKTKYDNTKYSVMSYDYSYPSAMKLGRLDKKAIKALYGAANTDGQHLSAWSWDKLTETLTHIGKVGDDRISGTAVRDVMIAQSGNDKLYGLAGDDALNGGDGNDVLIGGFGHDNFIFDVAANDAFNCDTIIDFTSSEDTISLSRMAFLGLINETGTLRAELFGTDRAAQTEAQRIVYDQYYSGGLYYDPDGSGSDAPIKIAQLGYYKGLTAGHILLI